MQLWILASENDGKIPNDIEEMKYRLRDSTINHKDVNLLIEKGLLTGCKHLLADDNKKCSETETETETEKNISSNGFDVFWKSYPSKKSQGQAVKSWLKLSKEKKLPSVDILISAIQSQISEKDYLRDTNQFCPEWKHPATWLNAHAWEDEISNQTKEEELQADGTFKEV